jgi:ABC-2 type transport system permease protein/oleandomycin transport system permease protein
VSDRTVTAPGRGAIDRRSPFVHGVLDAFAVAQRGLIALRRVPQYLVFSTIQPVIFVLMFRYVFGGAIGLTLGDIPYVDYLMPGIFVQTTTFGSMGTAIGLANDLNSGLLERFRSLPMARSAVMTGRTLSDLVRNVFVVILMVTVGFIVGFRVHTSALALIAGMALVALFGYALSWVFASVGLLARDPETAQAAAFPLMAPLVFASSVFVPVNTMPGWLQPFAEHQPISVTATAVRALVLGGDKLTPPVNTTAAVLTALAWIAGILIVFAPISVRLYRRAV